MLRWISSPPVRASTVFVRRRRRTSFSVSVHCRLLHQGGAVKWPGRWPGQLPGSPSGRAWPGRWPGVAGRKCPPGRKPGEAAGHGAGQHAGHGLLWATHAETYWPVSRVLKIILCNQYCRLLLVVWGGPVGYILQSALLGT